jgi:hypothetical protein
LRKKRRARLTKAFGPMEKPPGFSIDRPIAQARVGRHNADTVGAPALMEKLTYVVYPTDNEPGRAYLARDQQTPPRDRGSPF